MNSKRCNVQLSRFSLFFWGFYPPEKLKVGRQFKFKITKYRQVRNNGGLIPCPKLSILKMLLFHAFGEFDWENHIRLSCYADGQPHCSPRKTMIKWSMHQPHTKALLCKEIMSAMKHNLFFKTVFAKNQEEQVISNCGCMLPNNLSAGSVNKVFVSKCFKHHRLAVQNGLRRTIEE